MEASSIKNTRGFFFGPKRSGRKANQ